MRLGTVLECRLIPMNWNEEILRRSKSASLADSQPFRRNDWNNCWMRRILAAEHHRSSWGDPVPESLVRNLWAKAHIRLYPTNLGGAARNVYIAERGRGSRQGFKLSYRSTASIVLFQMPYNCKNRAGLWLKKAKLDWKDSPVESFENTKAALASAVMVAWPKLEAPLSPRVFSSVKPSLQWRVDKEPQPLGLFIRTLDNNQTKYNSHDWNCSLFTRQSATYNISWRENPHFYIDQKLITCAFRQNTRNSYLGNSNS